MRLLVATILATLIALIPATPNRVGLTIYPSVPVTVGVDYFAQGFALLKDCEGFIANATWDVTAYRNGHGTRAKRGEVIDRPTASLRARKAYQKCWDGLADSYPGIEDRHKAALAVALYNLGSFGPRLRGAIESGDPDRIALVLSLYVNVAGKPWPGLVNRRAKEIAFLRE